jgi:cell division protein FtsW (lipid II flippase)
MRRPGLTVHDLGQALVAATAGALVQAILEPPTRWVVLVLVVAVVLVVLAARP